jgi:3-phenylpropionate/trans-cinnamate dioxygenase ferredoxin reductase component
MATSDVFVIVGGGLAGAKAAEALRSEGFTGRVVLIGDEADRPYERPPLSKEYLQGRSEREAMDVHPPAWYADQEVGLELATRVTSIDPAQRLVLRDPGGPLAYDRLLLATGSSPRHLPLPGAELSGVMTLRRVGDSDALRQALATASQIAVIGAGWIGLEATAAARIAGVAVTMIETAPLPLLRVLGEEVAQVFADLHRDHGVDLRLGAQVEAITGSDGVATGVRLAGDVVVDADLVLVGVGVAPNTGLAEAAGLAVDNGVVVDEHLRTSAPEIFAAGDIARAFHPRIGTHIRVEHWANALNQPAVAARSMLGLPAVYDRWPYFYSDQYDLGMEYTGYVEPGGADSVVLRGDRDAREFIAFWLSDGRVLAGCNVNVWDVIDDIQALIGRTVDPARLADPGIPLADV